MPDLLGTIVSHYRILERLGEGGMGEVYLIALAAGDANGAAAAFAAGEPRLKMAFNRTATRIPPTLFANNLVLRDGLARARAKQGRAEEAIDLYRSLLTPSRDSKWTAMLEPRYVLALARLLDQAGRKDVARAEYRRFLDLWKNADADLPELTEARDALIPEGT